MKKISILLFAIAALGTGCKKFTDINQNPNQPTAVTPNVLLSAALTSSASNLGTDFDNTNCWMGYWSRSGSYIADNQTEGYGINTGYADNEFQALYGALAAYNNVENAANISPTTLAFYKGVAKTMKAVHFSTLVDGFGNVPYSQAFNINKYPDPKYDDAQTIYNSLITSLDSAVIYFQQAKAYYDQGSSTQETTDNQYDIVFGRGGSTDPDTRIAEWIEFANTVKLKLFIHESNLSPGTAAAELAKAVAAGGFLPAGTSAAVNPGYSTASQAQMNPFYGSFYTNAGGPQQNLNYYRANAYANNFYLNTGDDVRDDLVYAPLSNGNVGAIYEGDPAAASNALTSTIGPGVLKSPSQDQLIISDFESLFLQAEAAKRGWITGDPVALTKAAIEQNYIYLGATAADADAYLATKTNVGNVNVDPSTGLQAILTQKWIALNSINWFEAFTDYRRTGYPVASILGVSLAVNHVTHNGQVVIPYRFLYPQSEIDRNGANVPAGVTQYTPIFWDTLQK